MIDFTRAERLLSRSTITHRDQGVACPFIWNHNQKKIAMAAERQRSQGKPVRLILDKSRRVGGSSWTEGILFCMGLAYPRYELMVVSHQFKSSGALFKLPLGFLKDLPFNEPTPTQHEIYFDHPSGRSVLTLATAGSVGGGRGMTLHGLHISEAAHTIEGSGSFLSLIPTVSNRNPNTFVMIESTANGKVGEGEPFYQAWLDAVNHKSEYEAVFLSWLDDPACRIPDDLAEEEAGDAPSGPMETELMAAPFHATRAQIGWMRRMMSSPEIGGVPEKFMQEYPWTWEVSFISSGAPAFTHAEMAYARSTIETPKVGELLYERDQAGHLQPETIRFEEAIDGHYRLYRRPEQGHYYYVAADAARGIDTGDFAAASVRDGVTGEQCLVWDERVDPERLADILDAIGRWYSTDRNRPAMVNPELTGNLGLWAQRRLRDLYQYPNLYGWRGRDDKRAGKVTRESASTIGWETNWRTRELMFACYRTGLIYHRFKVMDEVTLSQMEQAQRTERIFQFEVTEGHDDVLMADMICCITIEQWPPPPQALAKRILETEDTTPSNLQNAINSAIVVPETIYHLTGGRNFNRVRRHDKRVRSEARAGWSPPSRAQLPPNFLPTERVQ